MGRKLLALICGLVTAWGTIIIGKMIATDAGYAAPLGLEFMSRAEISSYFASQPMPVYVILLIASILGGFFGGFIEANVGWAKASGAGTETFFSSGEGPG